VSKIISSDKVAEYNIQKFEFGSTQHKNTVKTSDAFSVFSKKEEVTIEEQKEDVKKDDEYKKLLEKVDALTSEVVSLQMKLENQEKEFEQRLIKEKDEAYNQGVKDTQTAQQDEIDNLKVQYISSITALQELELEIKEKLKAFEEELIETSIIIAKKVIKKEVEENSSKIAVSIARYLLNDIKDDIEVRLLVSPKDYEELLRENLKENIKIVSDNSVKEGGVILLSKEKNLDGTIESRFKKTLQLIKES